MPRTKHPTQATGAPSPGANGPVQAEVLTLAETAAYLRLPEADVLRLVDEQALPTRRLGNEWRFLKAAIQHWLGTGFAAMEQLLAERKSPGKFCHGDTPTVADICLVTQVTPGQLFKCKLNLYPKVMGVYEAAMAIPAFANAHPRKQADFEAH